MLSHQRRRDVWPSMCNSCDAGGEIHMTFLYALHNIGSVYRYSSYRNALHHCESVQEEFMKDAKGYMTKTTQPL